MLTDIQDSIKAKLYDFTYTPFMSSFLISWVVINHKYLLIYFSDYELPKKLEMLQQIGFQWWNMLLAPFLFGLFYVFVYPYASRFFYRFTLARNKELKEIKQKNEDETPITLEEAQKIRRKIGQLLDENNSLIVKLIQGGRDNLVAPGETQMSSNIKVESQRSIDEIFDERVKILKHLYYTEYKGQYNDLIKEITQKYKIPKVKAENIIDSFEKEGVCEVVQGEDGYWWFSMTQYGQEKLLEMFDQPKK